MNSGEPERVPIYSYTQAMKGKVSGGSLAVGLTHSSKEAG